MAKVPMHKGAMQVDNAADALTDLTSLTIAFAVEGKKHVGTRHAIGNADPYRGEGGRDNHVKGKVFFTTTDDEAYDLFVDWLLSDGARSVEVYKPDMTSGSIKLAFEGVLESFSPLLASEGGKGDLSEHDFSIAIEGAITKSTVV